MMIESGSCQIAALPAVIRIGTLSGIDSSSHSCTDVSISVVGVSAQHRIDACLLFFARHYHDKYEMK
jgi:hypothetical protein